MSLLLSSPSMAGFSQTSIKHRFTDAGSLSSYPIISAGYFTAKSVSLKRTARLKPSVKSRQDDYVKKQRFGSSSPFYVGHSIFKEQAVLTIEPQAPEFMAFKFGAFKLTKEGYLNLQFAPGAGVRKYDWSKKQVFTLSVTEIGNLVSLGPRESCEFFHDQFEGKSSHEGKVWKALKVEPLPDDSGRFFHLSVQNKPLNIDENIHIPITKAEFAVLIAAFNFIVPHLIGWNAFTTSIKPEDSIRSDNA